MSAVHLHKDIISFNAKLYRSVPTSETNEIAKHLRGKFPDGTNSSHLTQHRGVYIMTQLVLILVV